MKERYCLNCGKLLTRKQTKFCNNKCQQEYNYKEYIKRWKNGEESGLQGEYGVSDYIRKYLFKKYDNKCTCCGWGKMNPYTKTIPIDVEHIDGNYLNNKEENLILLCPNCHSLTPTYKGANRGKGRKARAKYYKTHDLKEIPKPAPKIEIKKKTDSEKREIRIEKLTKEHNITREILKEEIRTLPFTQIGKKHKVSDNAVRKWCKLFGLPTKSTEIKRYTDEEWAEI